LPCCSWSVARCHAQTRPVRTTSATQSPPALTSAPATQAQPTPTPRRAFKIGEPVVFQDGWKVTVTKFEEQASGRFFTPKPDFRFVAVILRFDNGTTKAISPNPFYFKLQDSAGVRRAAEFISDRSDDLTSSELAPGGFVTGSIVFSAPVGDKTLQLIYEHFGYAQTTFELY
jgi:hypothetical protein